MELFFRDARPLVTHKQMDGSTGLESGGLDPAAVSGILPRVAEQIGESAAQVGL